MRNKRLIWAYGLVQIVSLCLCLEGAAQVHETEVCSEIVTTLFPTPQYQYMVPASRQARLELRRCLPGIADYFQIIVWEANARKPSLVVQHAGESIVQMVLRGNVVIVEFESGTIDQVFAFVFEGGKPRMAIKETTKDSAKVITGHREVTVEVPNHWTGEVRRFVLKTDGSAKP
jgi:hypothetical protein